MDILNATKLAQNLLRQRRKEVLRMRKKKGMSLQEIGNKLKISRQRVHAIIKSFDKE